MLTEGGRPILLVFSQDLEQRRCCVTLCGMVVFTLRVGLLLSHTISVPHLSLERADTVPMDPANVFS